MKCPHCDYFYGWNPEELTDVYHKEGDFYKSPIKLERGKDWERDTAKLFGCPRCFKTFIEKYF